MIYEVVKVLQETIPIVMNDSSLSSMENLKFLLDLFKEYASGLKGKLGKEI